MNTIQTSGISSLKSAIIAGIDSWTRAVEREAAAKAEREAAEKELARIKAEAEAAAKKEREERAKLEAELAAKQAAEAKAAADAAAAQKKAARAPDKQKALTFAATVRTLKTPEATTTEGKAIMAEITAKIEAFAKWITVQAESL